MNAKEVMEMDKALIEMAKYAITKGGMILGQREQLEHKFRYFKGLVLTQEATLVELKDLVYCRYGDPGYVAPEFEGIREMVPEDLAGMPEQERL